MPVIKSEYKAQFLFQNAHLSTIYASGFRKVQGVEYQRERLKLTDGDFVDLDWSVLPDFSNSKIKNKLVIVTHGLLGDSKRHYVKSTVKHFNNCGWDALAWNHRGMSGEPNLFEKMTLHGSTDELSEIIEYVLKMKKYSTIVLVGWSKGGNISLKYAGEKGKTMPIEIKAVVGISVPTDIYGSVQVMGENSFYTNRFKKKIYDYLKSKTHLIDPEKFDEFKRYKSLSDFTEWYIAPLHGFKNAKDYYIKCSSIDYLPDIKVPTFILNALNDPILSMTCSPFQLAKSSEFIHLETPLHGGHCAFVSKSNNGIYWAEKRVFDFVSQFI
jgi:uncharacterized protein